MQTLVAASPWLGQIHCRNGRRVVNVEGGPVWVVVVVGCIVVEELLSEEG